MACIIVRIMAHASSHAAPYCRQCETVILLTAENESFSTARLMFGFGVKGSPYLVDHLKMLLREHVATVAFSEHKIHACGCGPILLYPLHIIQTLGGLGNLEDFWRRKFDAARSGRRS